MSAPQNQLVRTGAIRAPATPDDTYSSAEIAAQASTAPSLSEYINAIISQLRSLTGETHWYTPPAATIAALAAGGGGGASPSLFTATCQTSDIVGAFVCVDSTAADDGIAHVVTADITNLSLMPVVGIITTKPTSTTCTVQTAGYVQLAGLEPGQRYFVGPDGQRSPYPFATEPGSPYDLQEIGRALTNSTLLLTPTDVIINLAPSVP